MTEITILMPVFNGAETLKPAIESILQQSFTDFEFLIIDDGSADASTEIIRSYKDSRIRLIQNNTNIGLVRSLNLGIKEAKGALIARMDSDDISTKERLDIQREFLKHHRHFVACGSWATTFTSEASSSSKKILRKPRGEILKDWAWIPTPIIHPTVMIKSDIAKQFPYRESALHCEDYELWLRLLAKGYEIGNVQRCLLKYRIHSKSVTGSQRALQLSKSFEVFKEYFPHVSVNEDGFLDLIGSKFSGLNFQGRVKLTKDILKKNTLPASLWIYSLKRTLQAKLAHD